MIYSFTCTAFKAKIILTCLPVFLSFFAIAQPVIWSDNFNNGCLSNCVASTYGGWTIQDNVGGMTGGAPNNWFVSCAEEGITPPGCGSSCIGDASLHISNDPGSGGDQGASFNETGVNNATYRLVVSPTINTSNRQTLTLRFDFIAYGSASCSDDRAQLWLSSDNGATWPVAYQYCLNTVCCGSCNGYSVGQWTTYNLTLPAAFENNPNVKIAYHWRNNGNGSGTDPSVAIDDIRITGLAIVPVSLISFSGVKETNKVKLNWTSASEIQLNRYEIERSAQTTGFTRIGYVSAKGNQQGGNINYSTFDDQTFSTPVFYRLKIIDNNEQFKYSNIIRVGNQPAPSDNLSLISVTGSRGNIQLALWAPQDQASNISLYDMAGKRIADFGKNPVKKGGNQLSFNVTRIPVAHYMLKIDVPASAGKKATTLSGKFYYTR